MLWLVFALILAATLAGLIYPLWRAPKPVPSRADYDLAVYRAQLIELDADAASGRIGPEEAAAARLEIQRRMLTTAPGATPADDRASRRIAAVTILLMLPLATGLLYAALGQPQLPGRPYAGRLQHDPAVILADAAAKLNAALAAKPSAAGFRRLAELDLLQRDYDGATAALKHALRLDPAAADDWAELGEAEVLAAGGAVTPEALAAFAQALSIDARAPRARFYAGLAEAQIGQLKAAAAIWRDLEKDSRPDAPWLPLLKRELAELGQRGGFDPATVTPAPPAPAALNAAVAAMAKAMNRP
jgi:cytochrome c-type biogenesis protein CcmH